MRNVTVNYSRLVIVPATSGPSVDEQEMRICSGNKRCEFGVGIGDPNLEWERA